MKAKRSAYNVLFGIANQLIMIALGILLPRLVLVNLGSESNGLLTSVNQIFTYFALLEAGVGAATLQALYGPVGTEDRSEINRILAATDRYYKRTGVIYLLAFLALAIIYPLVVQSTLNKPVIFAVIVLTGFSGVLSYFFQGKYNILLLAEGKNYISSNLGSIVQIFVSVSKIALLLGGFNVVALQAMYCFFNVVKMLYIEWYIRRHYPWINLKAEPDFKAISQKNYVLIHQISSLIFNNTDTLILTLTLGLKSVSVYAMYTLLFGMVSTLIGTLTGSVQFILGQTFNNDREQYLKLHEAYEVGNMTLVFSLYCLANIFILPFMRLYTAGVTDINYIDPLLPFLFVAVYLLNSGRESSNLVIKFAGHYRQTVSRTIIESTINLAVSIICVWRFGIYGVLFGTIAALLFRANDMILYANRKILHRSPKKTYFRWLRNLLLFALCTLVGFRLPVDCSTYLSIVGWACVEGIGIICFFAGVNLLCEREVRATIWEYLKNTLPWGKNHRGGIV